jgi:hypothetical protein
MSVLCALCNQEVDPTSRTSLQRVIAWERRALSASRKSGSDIVLRERLDEFAHGHCIELARSGVSTSQESMSL